MDDVLLILIFAVQVLILTAIIIISILIFPKINNLSTSASIVLPSAQSIVPSAQSIVPSAQSIVPSAQFIIPSAQSAGYNNNQPRSLGLNKEVIHLSVHMPPNSLFDYQGSELYRLSLSNVKLSGNLQASDAPFWITQGYVCFQDGSGLNYHFGPYLVRLLYQSHQFFLYVPISYIQEWLSKNFIIIQDKKYATVTDLIISAGCELSSNTVIPQSAFNLIKENY